MFALILPFITGNWKLIGALVASAFVFFAGWQLRDYQADAQQLRQEKAYQEALKKALGERDALEAEYTKIAQDLETKLASMRRARDKAITERNREYAKPDYTGCIMPSNGLRIINEAIAEGNKSRNTR